VGLPFAWDKAFSPRLGAVLTPTPWFSFYGNFTRSFGVTNAVPIPGQPIFPPQTAQQFEGGVKIEFFDKRLTTTLAFYDITKTNIAQAVGGGSPFSTNVGRAESKGVEFDISGRINENWSLIGNYSHDDARIIQGMGISNNCGPGISCVNYGTFVNESGNRLQNVPLNAGNIWVKYDADGNLKGLSLGGGLNINGLRQGDNQNTFQLPAYTLVNAMVLYRFRPEFLPGVKNLTAQFNVKNLFNTTYYQNSSTNMSIFGLM
jgi:iron complex outermembrane receptor protein